MKLRQILIASLWAAAIAAVPVAAVAQDDYPPGGTQLVVRDLNGDNFFVPGEGGTASGVELTPDTAYKLEFDQDGREAIGEGRTDKQGSVLFTFKIPEKAKSGSATLVAGPSDGEGDEVTSAIRILTQEELQSGRRIVESSGWLPRSRIAMVVYVLLALALVGLGWALGTRSQRSVGKSLERPRPEHAPPPPPVPPTYTPPPPAETEASPSPPQPPSSHTPPPPPAAPAPPEPPPPSSDEPPRWPGQTQT